MKRTKITVAISKTTVIRRRRKLLQKKCPECGEGVWLLMLEDASATTGLPTQELCRLIGEGQLHFATALGSILMICPQSLAAWRSQHGTPDQPPPMDVTPQKGECNHD
ncbi:MAG: hypothetical protein HY231_12765 [Acidobacteria bacterium]|nr:hypothetical protein [Acidobacteriota bacterium]